MRARASPTRRVTRPSSQSATLPRARRRLERQDHHRGNVILRRVSVSRDRTSSSTVRP